MTRHTYLGAVAIVTVVAVMTVGHARLHAQAASTASRAVAANKDLVGQLAKELGATPEQAAGAAGTLFGVAKSRLNAEQFSQIAAAVPGMDSLLSAAPSSASPSPVGTSGALSQITGAATGALGSAANAFTKLGLKPDIVARAVPVLTSYVTKTGGPAAGNLLASVLK